MITEDEKEAIDLIRDTYPAEALELTNHLQENKNCISPDIKASEWGNLLSEACIYPLEFIELNQVKSLIEFGVKPANVGNQGDGNTKTNILTYVIEKLFAPNYQKIASDDDYEKCYKIVKLFLENGNTDPNLVHNTQSFPALTVACDTYNSIDIVKLLLDHGADPFQKSNKDGSIALHYARTPKVGMAILEEMHRINKKDVDPRDTNEETPFLKQAKFQNVIMMRFFKRQGANIYAVDKNSRNALTIFAHHSEKGAENRDLFKQAIRLFDKNDLTRMLPETIIETINKGHQDIFLYLTKNYPEAFEKVLKQDNTSEGHSLATIKQNLLQLAIDSKKQYIVETLIDKGYPLSGGHTPFKDTNELIQFAQQKEYPPIVALLQMQVDKLKTAPPLTSGSPPCKKRRNSDDHH